MKRWLVPLAAAAAVLVLLGGLWWLTGPGSRGDDSSFAGGDTDSSSGPTTGTGCTGPDTSVNSDDGTCSGGGSPGSSAPGSRGSGEPGVDPSPLPGEPVPKQTNPMGVVIDSYYQYDADRLAINYTIGVPECYGEIGEPAVEETTRSVTVTLTRIPPKQNENVACIEIALLKTVDIELSSPLGDRLVRDGSFDGAPVKTGTVPGDDNQAY